MKPRPRCSTRSPRRTICATSRGRVANARRRIAARTINAVSMTGGHLGAGLGVVELTVALHYVFDTPRRPADLGRRPPGLSAQDPTGRRARIRTLRQGGGLSGFTKRTRERIRSLRRRPSSTSISAGPRYGRCARPQGRANNVVAVIGDGAMSAGMAYEAMNNAGAMERLIVILNDNECRSPRRSARSRPILAPAFERDLSQRCVRAASR